MTVVNENDTWVWKGEQGMELTRNDNCEHTLG